MLESEIVKHVLFSLVFLWTGVDGKQGHIEHVVQKEIGYRTCINQKVSLQKAVAVMYPIEQRRIYYCLPTHDARSNEELDERW